MKEMQMILKNKNGDVFLEFLRVPESEASSFEPLTHSLIVAMYEGKSLIINNREKGHWELPGGRIDPGETPRECAVRELKEEANQRIPLEDVEFLGVMKFDLMPDPWNKASHLEYGALYRAKVIYPEDFTPNNEASAICFWNGTEDVGEIDDIDKKLIEMAQLDT